MKRRKSNGLDSGKCESNKRKMISLYQEKWSKPKHFMETDDTFFMVINFFSYRFIYNKDTFTSHFGVVQNHFFFVILPHRK